MYKQIVKHSKNDPLKLTKLAFHQIGSTDGTKEQNTEVCAGILCCWLVDKSKGKEFNSNSTSR